MEERNNLIDALNVIKKECEKHACCETCPMVYRNYMGEEWCYLKDNTPSMWRIKEREKEDIWKAFK